MGGMFKTPKMPEPKPPAPMPDPDSPAVLEAKRKAAGAIMNRAGRSSTILTAAATPSGSDAFNGSKLGS